MSISAKPGWDEFINDSGIVIPARGIVRLKDVVILAAGRLQLKVDQPNSYGDVGNCFIVGPSQVGIGKYGSCTRTALSGVVTCLYDETSGTPAYGQSWGPISGSFKLNRKGNGWLCLGAPVNTTRKLALFTPVTGWIVRGTIPSDAGPDTNKTLTVFTGAYGSEATTGETISNVRNASDCTLKFGTGAGTKIHSAMWVADNQTWQFIQGRTA